MMKPEISIVDNKKISCFIMTTNYGDAYIPYKISEDGILVLKESSFTDGIEEHGLLYYMIKNIVDNARSNKMNIVTSCIWVKSYLKLYPAEH